jgi:hypothetical protein
MDAAIVKQDDQSIDQEEARPAELIRARTGWRFVNRSAGWSLFAYTVVVVLLIWPTLRLYMWLGHYELFPVVQVYQISQLWSSVGPRHMVWSPEMCFGYGYPYFTFYAPLGFYLGAIFHLLLGLDYGAATRLSFYSSLYVSGLMMYGLVYTLGRRERWERLSWWAMAAATVYTLTRYHLTVVFVRDALAESWAWALLPGMFLGAEIARRRPWPGMLLISLMLCGFMLSHNITAMYGTLVLGLYVLITMRDLKWPVFVAAGGLLGAAMAAFFWVPAMRLVKLVLAGDMKTMWGSAREVSLQVIYWRQHLEENLGNGASIPGWHDELGINIGYAVLFGVTLAACAVVRPGVSTQQRLRIGTFLGFVALFLFVMSPQMRWDLTPAILRYVQFPWRLLIFTAFFGCLATALAAPVLNRWTHPLVWAGIAMFFALPTFPQILRQPLLYSVPEKRLLSWYAAQERLGVYGGTAAQDFMPADLDRKYLDPTFLSKQSVPPTRILSADGVNVTQYRHVGTSYTYEYSAPHDVPAKMALFYFPGWEVRVDGSPRPALQAPDGLVALSFPAGTHTLELNYVLSPIGKTSRAISIGAWLVWLTTCGFSFYRSRRGKHRGEELSTAPQA